MTLTSETTALGGLLKRIGNFDNSTLETRKVFQKTVYLLQSFGLYLGYNFNWYIHGPYSQQLATAGFELASIWDYVQRAEFAASKDETRFREFIAFLGDKKNDADWLEQLACIHFLRRLYPNSTKAEIVKQVLEHESHFRKQSIESAWAYLEDWKLI